MHQVRRSGSKHRPTELGIAWWVHNRQYYGASFMVAVFNVQELSISHAFTTQFGQADYGALARLI